MINESNNIWVQREAKKIDDYMKANAQAISQVDLSVNGDYAIKIVNYITSIYTFDKYVRTEIKLLQAIEKELNDLLKAIK